MNDSRYEGVRAAIVKAEIEGSEAGMAGNELRALVFLAALDAAHNTGGGSGIGGVSAPTKLPVNKAPLDISPPKPEGDDK